MTAATAVGWAIRTRVAFFPSRCAAEHHGLLLDVADYAETCLRNRYGTDLELDVNNLLHLHWADITKHVGPRRQHILGVFGTRSSTARTRVQAEAAKAAKEKVALRAPDC